MIRRPIIWHRDHVLRQRLRRLLDRAVARRGTGLRCQGMHAKRPEGPALSGQRPPLPARAMSAQVKLASPVYPVYPVRRADRGPAPITRLIHLPPPAVPSPDPGPRSDPAANSAGSRATPATRVPSPCPLTDTERPLSCQIQAGPRCAARDQRQRETPGSQVGSQSRQTPGDTRPHLWHNRTTETIDKFVEAYDSDYSNWPPEYCPGAPKVVKAATVGLFIIPTVAVVLLATAALLFT